MADKSKTPVARENAIEFTEDAFQEMIRQGADVAAPAEGETPTETRTVEPEVKIEGEDESPVERIGDVQPVNKGDGEPATDIKKALETIDRLERENTDLRESRTSREGRGERPKPSPMKEVAPGILLPEDRRMWPIQLTDDIVKGVGLDPGEKGEITQGLNMLANMLVTEIVGNLMPRFVGDYLERHTSSRESAAEDETRFFGAFSDLKDKRDLLDAVELRIQREVGAGRRQYTKREDYLNDLARETRTRVAALRGQSYGEYLSTVTSTRTRGNGGGRSRAVTTSGGRSGRKAAPQNEMDDLIDNTER